MCEKSSEEIHEFTFDVHHVPSGFRGLKTISFSKTQDWMDSLFDNRWEICKIIIENPNGAQCQLLPGFYSSVQSSKLLFDAIKEEGGRLILKE